MCKNKIVSKLLFQKIWHFVLKLKEDVKNYPTIIVVDAFIDILDNNIISVQTFFFWCASTSATLAV